nr:rRNA cytosine-C5-methylase [Alistipes sp.]
MLPEKFVDRVLRDLGETEGAALCAALDAEPPVSVRLNPAKTGPETAAAGCGAEQPAGPDTESDSGCNATPAAGCDANPVAEPDAGHPGPGTAELPALTIAGCVPWCREGRYLAVRPAFTLDPDFHAGAYYVQEASSQFVGHLLAAVPTQGARILDLCAAPGGKTTLYASLAGPDGLVVANEIDRRRASVLADNVRKWGTGNVAVTTCEPRALGDFEAWFDVVAVDAPCSGEGMFRKDPDARGEWSEGHVKLCAARQDDILREAWRALRPGGTLVYSTCTFNRDEDEGSLERMAAWAGDEIVASEAMPVEDAWGIVCGRVGAFRTFRFYPHRACGEGFFAAVARKSFDAGGRVRTPKARRTPFAAVDRKTSGELARWVQHPDRMRFAAVADTCYAWYAAQADAVRMLSEALPVIYSGVALGQVFKGVLKPDPALAFFDGLNRGALPVAELDGEEVLRFLRRQEIAAGGLAEGMNLICSRGRALGFAKRIGVRVNNLYPNSLRIIKQ